MTASRAVELSMFPEVAPDRPRGPLLGSLIAGTNADLITAIAPLYLDGATVMDVTYGTGAWWRRWRPDDLITHDLAVDGVDFRQLPEADNSVDVVCFDPPYIPQGGVTTSTAPEFLERFGLTSRSRAELWQLHNAGLAECARVARRWVIAKCCDFVNGGAFWLGHVELIHLAEAHGLAVHDLIVHHTGAGPGGHNIVTPLRARRHHSYLVVLAAQGATP